MAHDVASIQRRTVGVLSGAQVLGGLGVGANVAAGALIAVEVAGTESVAGLASTTSVLGAALAAIPLASLTSDRGRRHGLAAGLLVGSAGAVLVVIGAEQGWLLAVLVGTMLTGAAAASGLQARYAATDLAPADRAAGALSIVVWATTIGAVVGPNLNTPGTRIGTALGYSSPGGVLRPVRRCLPGRGRTGVVPAETRSAAAGPGPRPDDGSRGLRPSPARSGW